MGTGWRFDQTTRHRIRELREVLLSSHRSVDPDNTSCAAVMLMRCASRRLARHSFLTPGSKILTIEHCDFLQICKTSCQPCDTKPPHNALNLSVRIRWSGMCTSSSSLFLQERVKIRDRQTQQLHASVTPSTCTQFRQSDRMGDGAG